MVCPLHRCRHSAVHYGRGAYYGLIRHPKSLWRPVSFAPPLPCVLSRCRLSGTIGIQLGGAGTMTPPRPKNRLAPAMIVAGALCAMLGAYVAGYLMMCKAV